MVFRFVIKKSPLSRKAHLEAPDIPRTLGQLENRSIQALAGFGSREINTSCCVPSSRNPLDALFHGRARMTDMSFHIVATFCIQGIAYDTSLRLDHRMDKILQNNDLEGGKHFTTM
jgi:hypothetical protein